MVGRIKLLIIFPSIRYMSPYFIITAGATGSGKTGLINKTMEYLNISDQPYEKILVDDLIENDINYKNKVKKIIDYVSEYCVGNKTCEI